MALVALTYIKDNTIKPSEVKDQVAESERRMTERFTVNYERNRELILQLDTRMGRFETRMDEIVKSLPRRQSAEARQAPRSIVTSFFDRKNEGWRE